MPIVYSGVPSNVAGISGRNGASATIATVSNATPCLVTTTAAHLFGDGDLVLVSGVSGSTTANNTPIVNPLWTINVISSTTFELVGSTAGGAGSGGAALDYSLTPQFQIPKDGEAPTALSLWPAIKTLADRTQFINDNLGPLRTANLRTMFMRQDSQQSTAMSSSATSQTYLFPFAFDGLGDDIFEFFTSGVIQLNAGGSGADLQCSVYLQSSLDGGTTWNTIGGSGLGVPQTQARVSAPSALLASHTWYPFHAYARDALATTVVAPQYRLRAMFIADTISSGDTIVIVHQPSMTQWRNNNNPWS